MKFLFWIITVLIGAVLWGQDLPTRADSTSMDTLKPSTYLVVPESQIDTGNPLNMIISTSVTDLGQNVAEILNLAPLYASDSLFCDSDSCLNVLAQKTEANRLIAWSLKKDYQRTTFELRLYNLETGILIKSRNGIYPADPKYVNDFVKHTITNLLAEPKPIIPQAKQWVNANKKTSGYVIGGIAAIAIGYKLFSGKSSTGPGIGQPPDWPQQ